MMGMANNTSGFFRVSKLLYNDGRGLRYSYQIHNSLVNDEIRLVDIMDLKNRVESKGYLWGIIDMKKAEVIALEQGYRIEDLQGRYGLQVNEKWTTFIKGSQLDSCLKMKSKLQMNLEMKMKSALQMNSEMKSEMK